MEEEELRGWLAKALQLYRGVCWHWNRGNVKLNILRELLEREEEEIRRCAKCLEEDGLSESIVLPSQRSFPKASQEKQLSSEDGLEKESGVLVLAATNRPDTLDSALLRPGRLDRAIYVPLPDEDTRLSILRLHLNGMQIGEDVDMDELVSGTSGYSGAEIVALCRQAALIAMRENIDAEMVQRKHFLESFKAVVPRTDPKLLDVYENFKKGTFA